MSEEGDAFRFTAKVGEDGSIVIPPALLVATKLTKDDSATFEIVPSKPVTEAAMPTTSHELEVKQRTQEAEEVGRNTFNFFLPLWMKNFRTNIDLIPTDAKTISSVSKMKGSHSAIVCGAGPSFKDTDFQLLGKYKDPIVATNKTLIPLLKHQIVPDWVVALDALPEVWNSFNDPIVKKHKGEINFLGPTVLYPTVTKFVLKWAKECYWGNPHVPSGEDTDTWNLNVVLELFNGLEVLRHGGNVGTTAWLLAKALDCNPIGMLGFDLCFHPDDTWKREDAIKYEYFYNPENKELMAVDSPFRAYFAILTDVSDMAWSEGVATVNLTPNGVLFSSSLFPNLTLKEFVEGKPEVLRKETKKVRARAVKTMMERIQAIRESQKPIFRTDL